ncbi:hypothetical protein ACEWY4_012841 [Coilia grayii]|uniref:LRRCT domain-containing protein n=1 Tax=Coilia grayii TaxID=363190 RepID=A0ABD1JUK6_9TELE
MTSIPAGPKPAAVRPYELFLRGQSLLQYARMNSSCGAKACCSTPGQSLLQYARMTSLPAGQSLLQYARMTSLPAGPKPAAVRPYELFLRGQSLLQYARMNSSCGGKACCSTPPAAVRPYELFLRGQSLLQYARMTSLPAGPKPAAVRPYDLFLRGQSLLQYARMNSSCDRMTAGHSLSFELSVGLYFQHKQGLR